MNFAIKQTKKNEHGKYSREFKAERMRLNKVREIKSREFIASENEYTTRIQVYKYKGPYGIIFHSNEQCKIAIHFAEHNFGPGPLDISFS
jgi:hypothetical protein